MLCYRCGSYNSDDVDKCQSCGIEFQQKSAADTTTKLSTQDSVADIPEILKVGDLINNRYLVNKILGAGNIGVVYRVKDSAVDVDLALKAFPARFFSAQENRDNFQNQYKTIREFSHHNIVKLYECGFHQENGFVTTQFLEGLTLGKIIGLRKERKNVFDLDDIERFFAQLCQALEYTGRITAHGNLHPFNIIVQPDVLKITDFAISKTISITHFVESQKDSLQGRYLAPEVLAGQTATPASDIYSLAMIMAEMLTGKLYDPKTPFKISENRPELPEHLGVKLDKLFLRSINPKIDQRHRKVKEFFSELTSIIEEYRFIPPKPTSNQDIAPTQIRENKTKTVAAEKTNQKKKTSSLPIMLAALILLIISGIILYSIIFTNPEDKSKVQIVKENKQVVLPAIAEEVVDAGEATLDAIVVDIPEITAEKSQDKQVKKVEVTRKSKNKPQKSASKIKIIKRKTKVTPKKVALISDNKPQIAPIGKCLPGMIYIPGGQFKLGSSSSDPLRNFGEINITNVDVPNFCIDIYEYPNTKGGKPLAGLSWYKSKLKCESRGKRLCAEKEWEKACKGPGNLRFPYSNSFNPSRCNTEDDNNNDRNVGPSGTFAGCRSGYGVADMSGNVAEWTSTKYSDMITDKVYKGGDSTRPDYATRCATRFNMRPGGSAAILGFRCCAAPNESEPKP